MRNPRLILASASPRRRELLSGLGLQFEVAVSSVEEVRQDGEEVEAYVGRLAREKGATVALANRDAWIISADTVVWIEGDVLEKPRSVTEARAMLRRLAGARHIVYSGVSLQNAANGYAEVRVVSTGVTFTAMSDEQIAWYVDTGEPMDKAGAYAVQGIGAMFIESVEGNYSNVVGLPLSILAAMFQRAGLELFHAPAGGVSASSNKEMG